MSRDRDWDLVRIENPKDWLIPNRYFVKGGYDQTWADRTANGFDLTYRGEVVACGVPDLKTVRHLVAEHQAQRYDDLAVEAAEQASAVDRSTTDGDRTYHRLRTLAHDRRRWARHSREANPPSKAGAAYLAAKAT